MSWLEGVDAEVNKPDEDGDHVNVRLDGNEIMADCDLDAHSLGYLLERLGAKVRHTTG